MLARDVVGVRGRVDLLAGLSRRPQLSSLGISACPVAASLVASQAVGMPDPSNVLVHGWRDNWEATKWMPSSSCQQSAPDPGTDDEVAREIVGPQRQRAGPPPILGLPRLPGDREWRTIADSIVLASVPRHSAFVVTAESRRRILLVDSRSNCVRSPSQLLITVCVIAGQSMDHEELAAVVMANQPGRIRSSLSWPGTAWPGRGCLERMEANLA